MMKRVLALLLSLTLVFSLMGPTVVYAEEGSESSNIEAINNYVRVTSLTGITDGIYVMAGARSGYNLNKAILSDTSYSAALDVSDAGVITSDIDDSYLWTIISVEDGYTIQNSDDQYLYIYASSEGSANAVQTRSSAYTMTIENASALADSFYIGGPAAANDDDNTGYLNHRSEHTAGICTWTGKDIGSCIYLYKEDTSSVSYRVTADAVAAATSGVQSKIYYTEDSYETYKSALAAAKTIYDTEDGAETAYNALVAAVNALVDSGLEAVTFNTANNNISWKRTEDTSENYVANVAYVNSSNAITSNGVTYPQYTALTWNWSSLNKLINDADTKVDDVWSTQSDGMSACQFSANKAQNWDYENFYKISGTFEWPADYDLNDTTISLTSVNDDAYSGIYDYIEEENLSSYFDGSVIPVNDDVYVVMWVEDGNTTITADNINNYLLFWTGTSGKGIWTNKGTTPDDWNRETPATFISAMKQGVRAFRNAWPNAVGAKTGLTNSDVSNYDFPYLTHTDGWYTITDTSAINTVMRNNYRSIQAGATVHLDLYVANNDGTGVIDELEITLAKKKVTEADVTVMYYYNEVSDDTYLGSSVMTNQTIGSTITLTGGTNASQLDYLKSAATAATKKEMNSGVQLNNLTVQKDSSQNIIRVLYTAVDSKTIYLTAATDSIKYTGNPITLNEVTVTEVGEDQTGFTTNGTYTLPDGNTLKNAISVVTGTDPGIYDNEFTDASGNTLTYVVENSAGQQITDTYTIITIPGTLTITYEPADVFYTYDFAVDNVYDNVLNEVEQKAASSLPEAADDTVADVATYDSDSNTITYTPYTVNTGYTAEMTLTFTGNYQVTKDITFLPASNVLYEESFISYDEGDWTEEIDEVDYEMPEPIGDNDGDGSVYGYTEANVYDQVGTYSSGTALYASLNLSDSDYVETKKAATFTFTGTGFDLISACSDNTGMILAVVKDANNKAVKSYLVDTYFSEGANGQDDYQVPVIRNLELPYGEYTISAWACTTDTSGAASASMANTQSTTTYSASATALSSQTAAAADTTEIVKGILADLNLSDVDPAAVEVSYVDENSVLNGGTGPEAAANANDSGTSNKTNLWDKLIGFLKGNSGSSTLSIAPSDDETTASTITVYLDGFRVYQPLGAEPENEPAIYATDGENDTKYYSVYDFVQTSVNEIPVNEWVENAAVYVEYDGDRDVSEIATYKNQGPQNEVYLSPGCAIAFALENYKEGDVVQIGAKSVNEDGILTGVSESLSATEMYYDITESIITNDKDVGVPYVIISNESEEGLLALSGLKVSSGITAMANAELADKVTQRLNATEEASFVPAYFTATAATSVKANRSFSITANTSTDDVEKVIIAVVGGEEYTLSPTNSTAVKNGKSSTYKFSKAFKISESTTFEVYAVNEAGERSEPIVLEVNVQ